MGPTDINRLGWIGDLPESWQPFAILMRLDRPIGWWLLALPGIWGIVLGANGIIDETGKMNMYGSDIRLIIYFIVGAIVMRGAGCIINDIWDRELDKEVERTKERPLASGEVSLYHASIMLFCLFFLVL